MATNYKDTVFLPKTDFSMRGNRAQKDPADVKRWLEMDLYGKRLQAREGRDRFTLHDGPPYANGNLHLGHTLNKVLKDIVVKAQFLLGKDTPYVPGWDCHGLPIEAKIEETFKKKGKSRDDVPVLDFIKECRAYADKWINTQLEQFQSLGVLGDWDNHYRSMNPKSEADIVRELGKFLENGNLVQGFKPVMWSVVEGTALAEAEVEYYDKTSPSIYVAFPIEISEDVDLVSARAIIWTTTPWTIPANRAIAYGDEIDYVLIQVTEVTGEMAQSKVGDKFVVAKDLLETLKTELFINAEIVKQFVGSDLKGTIAKHPLNGMDPEGGYDFDVPLLAGGHVSTEAGTGLVHTAPGHGPDDFILCQEHGIEVPRTVSENGLYYDQVGLFTGLHVFKADQPVMDKLTEAGALLMHSEIKHSYPHSWRSKKPLIFRTTPQWFISMEANNLRQKCLSEITQVQWLPTRGQNRITAMVADRPDWCISRQRTWGVPITVFIHKETGELLRDMDVHERIAQAIETRGMEAWIETDKQEFLGDKYMLEDYEAATDILDVWFDSGCTHAFVVGQNDRLDWPVDLYLEGSDQHRGWFQTSLIEACATRGQAPYKTVLTHGFVLDKQGRKMSKSLGNVIEPKDVMTKSGAEILRLWVVNSDYSEDIRIGQETLQHQSDIYRRLRNTLRYLLGALDGFNPATDIMDIQDMPELEQYILHQLDDVNKAFTQTAKTYDYQKFYTDLHTFCSNDLSAYYFDIRKDNLYCDGADDAVRRAARTVYHHTFEYLVRWLSPVLSFTAEEAWLSRYPDTNDSVHLQELTPCPDMWHNAALAQKFETVRIHRRLLTGALEEKRASNMIGSALQASVVVYDQNNLLDQNIDWAEQAITSSVDILNTAAPAGEETFTIDELPGISALVVLARGKKCERCWKVTEEVGTNENPDLCNRCDDVIQKMEQAA